MPLQTMTHERAVVLKRKSIQANSWMPRAKDTIVERRHLFGQYTQHTTQPDRKDQMNHFINATQQPPPPLLCHRKAPLDNVVWPPFASYSNFRANSMKPTEHRLLSERRHINEVPPERNTHLNSPRTAVRGLGNVRNVEYPSSKHLQRRCGPPRPHPNLWK
jgi:hypothetical protein